jgi:hypothetical protein
MLACRAAVLSLLLLPLPLHAQDGPPVGFGFSYLKGTDDRTVVTAVAPGGAAETAGLAAGDVLVAVNGEPVTGPAADVHGILLAARDAGAMAAFKVSRNGTALTLSLGTAPYDTALLTRLAAVFLCVSGDCIDGEGAWVAPDGERYAGAFVRGRRHGEGRLSLTNGDLYVGTFRDGTFDGRGTYVWADGSVYAGEVRAGAPHGHGVRTAPNGVYSGEFVAGARHGTGTFRRSDGTFWQGTWVDDVGVGGTGHAPDGTPQTAGAFFEDGPAAE